MRARVATVGVVLLCLGSVVTIATAIAARGGEAPVIELPPRPEEEVAALAMRVADQLRARAAEGPRGNLIPVDSVVGARPDAEMQGFAGIINLAFVRPAQGAEPYPWGVLATSDDRAALTAQVNRELLESANEERTELFLRRVIEPTEAARARALYSVMAEWTPVSETSERIRLEIRVQSFRTSTLLISDHALLIHPAAYALRLAERSRLERARARRDAWTRSARLAGLTTAGIGGVAFAGAFLVGVHRRRWMAANAPALHRQLDELLARGAYTAAHRLAERMLSVAEDAHVDAVRKRILDRTKGDPQRAESAWVRILEYQRLVRSSAGLTPTQLAELEGVCREFFPDEAGLLLEEYKGLGERRVLLREISRDVSLMRQLQSSGELERAAEVAGRILRNPRLGGVGLGPGEAPGEVASTALVVAERRDELSEIVAAARSIREHASRRHGQVQQLMQEADAALRAGDVGECRRLCGLVREAEPGTTQASALIERLAVAARLRQWQLRPAVGAGAPIRLFTKSTIDLYRPGQGTGAPDVPLEHPAVSRMRHARLRLVEGVAELTDLGSTVGTAVNGARIERAELADGDNVVFGEVLPFRVSLTRDGTRVGGVALIGAQVVGVVGSTLRIDVESGMADGSLALKVSDGVLLVEVDGGWEILDDGLTIAIAGRSFHTTAIRGA